MKKCVILIFIIILLSVSFVQANFFDFLLNGNQITGKVFLGFGSANNPGGNGYMCDENAECISGWCDSGYCCDYGLDCCMYGPECPRYTGDYDGQYCTSEYYCADYEKKANGESCAGEYDEICQSNWCENDICCNVGEDCCATNSDCGSYKSCNNYECVWQCELNGNCCSGSGSCSSGYTCNTASWVCVASSNSNTNTNCASGCSANYLGDGYCDSSCNNYACNYDNGDCETQQSTTSDCTSGCPSSYLGDGYCDSSCNNYACNYDNGDCESSTTTLTSSGGYCTYSSDCDSGNCMNSVCCSYGYTCCDDNSDCTYYLGTGYTCDTYNYYCTYSSTTDCASGCPSYYINNGVCDTACNNYECNYDGSDCGSSYAPSTTSYTDQATIDSRVETIKSNLNKKIEISPSPQIRISMAPYPLPKSLELDLQEKEIFYLTIQNTGNIDVDIVYYSVTSSQDWVSAPAVLWDGTSKTNSLSINGKKLKKQEILESLPMEIEGSIPGTMDLTVNVNYYSSRTGENYYETLTVPVTVSYDNVNKNEDASDAFGVETLDEGEALYGITITDDYGYTEYVNYGVIVKPTDWGEMTKLWNMNAGQIAYYRENVKDDLTGAVSPDVVGFLGDVQSVTSENTAEGVQNVVLRSVTPGAIKMGYDLGRLARYSEETKKQDDLIKSAFGDAKFGWVYFNDEKTRVMYKTSGDTTYIVKVGVI